MALEPLRAGLYSLKTGDYLRAVPVSSAPWSKEIGAWGKFEVKVPRSRSANLPVLRRLAEPWYSMLVISRGRRVLQAGPVIARPFGTNLTIKAEGFGAAFRKRLVLSRDLRGMTLDGEILIDEDNPAPEWVLTFDGSYGDIGAQLIEETLEWGDFPVVTGPREGGNKTRTYFGYDLATVEERLLQLGRLENGPEQRFRPELVPGGVLFHYEAATELVSKHHRWNTAIPGDACTIGTIDDDGEGIVTEQWMLGGRNEDIMLMTRGDDGTKRSDAVNLIPDPRYTDAPGVWTSSGVNRTQDAQVPGRHEGVQHWGLALTEPTTNDGFASVGGDIGGIRLGMVAGRTYVVSAEGSVRKFVAGEQPPEVDANGGERSRARSIVVHAFDTSLPNGGDWRIWHSAQLPNIEGAQTRVALRFTLPLYITQAFIRYYHGGTEGAVTWSKFRLAEVTNQDPTEEWAEYFWGGQPQTSEYLYTWRAASDASPSDRQVKDDAPHPLIGYPLLQMADTSHTTVSEIETLRGYRREAIGRGARTQEVIDVHVSAEEDVEPGDWADVRTKHPLYGEVLLPLKVVGVSGGTGTRIKLSCRIRNDEEVST